MKRKTPRENYLGMAKGEKPDDLVFLGGYNPFAFGEGQTIQYVLYGPSLTNHEEDYGGVDLWGVNWIAAKSGGTQPEHGKYILPDIEKWREYIKAPDLSEIDWESMAKSDLAECYSWGVSPIDTVMSFWTHPGYVTMLTNFMGFSEALMALLESPEEVYDLFAYLNDFYCQVLEHALPFYKPDTYHMFDTYAGSTSPFYSVDTYKELVLPFQMKEAEIMHRHNIPIEMHCAGLCQSFMDAFQPLDFAYWLGVENSNDVKTIMKKYPHLNVAGVWQQTPEILSETCTEEEFKASVKEIIDQYAPTGRFAWFDCILANEENAEDAAKKNEWLREVLYGYGREIMQR